MCYTKRCIVAILILIALVSVATIQAQEYRPETGTFVKDTLRNGLGELKVINDNPQMDAVAILNIADKGAVLAVYIRSKTSFTISGINDGSYDMYFEIGNTWNSSSDRFTDGGGFYRLDRSLPFETIERFDGTEYSAWTVALEEAAPNANEAGRKISVNEDDFPDLK